MWITLLTAFWLLAGSIMDIKRRRISIWLLVAGIAFSMSVSIWQCVAGERGYGDIVSGAFPGTGLFVIALATGKAGYGDGIALLCLGMLLGGGKSLLLLGLSLIFISVVSLVLLVVHKAGRNTPIPYLPFLTGAWLVVTMMIKN